MFQLLKIHLDENNHESFENLSKLPLAARKEWLKKNLEAVLRTLETIKIESERNLFYWNLIGQTCLNDNLYREAEVVYDILLKKIKEMHGNLGMPSYYRGISRFLQGRFKDAFEDFKSSRQFDLHAKNFSSPAMRAISYMEETIFPTKESIRKNHDRLVHDLNMTRQIEYKVGANALRTLHKWNSSSPLFSRGESQGGGYLLTLRNPRGEIKGIAVDPGYDFFDLFRSIGLSIIDIDAIIITHDHDDHTESLEGILSLLAKYNDYNQEKKSKVLDVFGSAGTLLKFHGLLSATDPYGNKEINFKLLVPGNTVTQIENQSLKEKHGFTLRVNPAYHNELWTGQESAIGVVIETSIKDKNGEPLNIGITGDTRYVEGMGQNYKDCRMMLINIGSIEKEEGKLLSQHLGMLGCINLIKEARIGKPLLGILTEFGEEFSGRRRVMSRIIEDWAHPVNPSRTNGLMRIIPADVSLEVRLDELSIRDCDTNVFFPYQTIQVEEPRTDLLKYKFNG